MGTRSILLSGAVLLSGAAFALPKGTCHENETPRVCIDRLDLAGGVQRGRDVRTSYEGSSAGQELRQDSREVGSKIDEAGRNASRGVTEAVDEARHPRHDAMGVTTRGEVRNTLTTDPLATVLGSGVNAQYERPFSPKLSGVAGASFGRLSAGDGAVYRFGGTLGADYFAIGRDNEGLRIGPRVNVGVGRETIGSASTFASLGLDGELGYNWIARSGLTAGAAGGLGIVGATSSNQQTLFNRTEAGAAFDRYLKLNLGYSW